MTGTSGRPVGANRATAARLAQAGWPVPHIARRLDVTESWVYRALKAEGVELDTGPDWHAEHWTRRLRATVSLQPGVYADCLTLAEYRQARP